MSIVDVYTKPIEQIITEGKICLSPTGIKTIITDLGHDYEVVPNWWKAQKWGKFEIAGEGETPRAAIIDLYNKM